LSKQELKQVISNNMVVFFHRRGDPTLADITGVEQPPQKYVDEDGVAHDVIPMALADDRAAQLHIDFPIPTDDTELIREIIGAVDRLNQHGTKSRGGTTNVPVNMKWFNAMLEEFEQNFDMAQWYQQQKSAIEQWEQDKLTIRAQGEALFAKAFPLGLDGELERVRSEHFPGMSRDRMVGQRFGNEPRHAEVRNIIDTKWELYAEVGKMNREHYEAEPKDKILLLQRIDKILIDRPSGSSKVQYLAQSFRNSACDGRHNNDLAVSKYGGQYFQPIPNQHLMPSGSTHYEGSHQQACDIEKYGGMVEENNPEDNCIYTTEKKYLTVFAADEEQRNCTDFASSELKNYTLQDGKQLVRKLLNTVGDSTEKTKQVFLIKELGLRDDVADSIQSAMRSLKNVQNEEDLLYLLAFDYAIYNNLADELMGSAEMKALNKAFAEADNKQFEMLKTNIDNFVNNKFDEDEDDFSNSECSKSILDLFRNFDADGQDSENLTLFWKFAKDCPF